MLCQSCVAETRGSLDMQSCLSRTGPCVPCTVNGWSKKRGYQRLIPSAIGILSPFLFSILILVHCVLFQFFAVYFCILVSTTMPCSSLSLLSLLKLWFKTCLINHHHVHHLFFHLLLYFIFSSLSTMFLQASAITNQTTQPTSTSQSTRGSANASTTSAIACSSWHSQPACT